MKRNLLPAVVITAGIFVSVTMVAFGGNGNHVTEIAEEEPVPVISGVIEHTPLWDENRESFNSRCSREGESQWLRREDTYFSGEKFVLSASVTGKAMPSSVGVEIEGTGYKTRLYPSEPEAEPETEQDGGDRGEEWCAASYSGTLFEPEMIYRWAGKGPEHLTFIFSAYIDGELCRDRQQIVMDDRVSYWLMHRKT